MAELISERSLNRLELEARGLYEGPGGRIRPRSQECPACRSRAWTPFIVAKSNGSIIDILQQCMCCVRLKMLLEEQALRHVFERAAFSADERGREKVTSAKAYLSELLHKHHVTASPLGLLKLIRQIEKLLERWSGVIGRLGRQLREAHDLRRAAEARVAYLEARQDTTLHEMLRQIDAAWRNRGSYIRADLVDNTLAEWRKLYGRDEA